MHRDLTKFDEADYLAANPDVAAAVRSGVFASGAEHYARYGINENRVTVLQRRDPPLQLPFPSGSNPTRRDKILANLNLNDHDGLEIGALARPLVSRSEGKIFYVDYTDAETLRAKYANDPEVDTSKIVQVDAVWGEQTLQDCIGKDRKVDYVVASHVIEHVPDRLAVPDRRYTFDYLRFESRLHDVLDAYLQRARAPLPRLIIEFHNLIRDVDHNAAWKGPIDPESLPPRCAPRAGLEAAIKAISTGAYYDTHCWVFTPLSFATLFGEIAELDLLGFSCEYYFETVLNEIEFFVHLTPCDDKNKILASWTGMKTGLQRPTPPPRSARKRWVKWF